ncbi:MAG: hypothetical protein GY870_03715 [archaeon]|nr:hypothetical protein [archaeon]
MNDINENNDNENNDNLESSDSENKKYGNWVDDLPEKEKEKLRKKKEKDEKKEQKRKEREKKQKELMDSADKSFRKVLHDQFQGILDENKILYTIIFLLGAFFIGILYIFDQMVASLITLVFFIGYLVLAIFSLIPVINKHMFQEGGEFIKKIGITIISLAIGTAISIPYFALTTIPVLSWNTILPPLFVIIYFGWNLIQVHFVKDTMQGAALNIEIKIKDPEFKIQKDLSLLFLILGLIFPFILHTITVSGYWSNLAGNQNFFLFIGWTVVVYGMIIFLDYWQIQLYMKSKRNETTNIFSNMFYILMWILFGYRSFGVIKALPSAGTGIPPSLDPVSAIIDFLLVALTSLLVLRSLAKKVKKSNFVSEDAIPFVVYAFTILYVAGQAVILVIGSIDRSQLSMINNIMLFFTGVIYYMWYSNFYMQRKGYIQRQLLTISEATDIVNDFAENLIKDIPDEKTTIKKILEDFINKYHLIPQQLDESSEKMVKRDLEKKEPKEKNIDFIKNKFGDITSKLKEKIKFKPEDKISKDVDEDIQEKTEEMEQELQETKEEVEFDSEDDIEKNIEDEIENITNEEEEEELSETEEKIDESEE